MLATANLLVLSLWVLPGEIRKRLNAERNLPEKKRKEVARLTRRAKIRELAKHDGRRRALALLRPVRNGCKGRLSEGGEAPERNKEADPSESRA